MPSVDELWAWVSTPIEELLAQYESDRERPWEELRAYFLERAGLSDPSQHPLVAELVRQLDELPDQERGALFDDRDRLPNLARELCEQYADDDESGDGAGYDEAEWQRFLMENGPRWAGDEESWPQFTEWFVYVADEAGVGQPATSLVEFLGGQPVPERIATFAQYGVTIEIPVDEAEPTELTEEEIQEILAEGAQFDDIPEERRRELINEVLGQG